MTLEQFFAENREVAVAFSGGVDSAYLLYAATRYAARVKAYYVSTAFQPEFELADARRLADELGADMLVLRWIFFPTVRSRRTADRCYHCKNTLFRQILRAAESDGFALLLDGTNASDDAGDRPGMRALRELSVRSPLRECGLTRRKSAVFPRKPGCSPGTSPPMPASPPDTHRGGNHASKAEADGKGRGLLVRARVPGFPASAMVGNIAKLELREADLPLLLEHREKIVTELRKDYDSVLLNLEVRK